MQLGEDDLDAGQAGLRLLVDRDAATLVVHLGRPVGMEGDLDQVAGTGECFVHAVVDDLPQAVHETAGVGGADVHPRALADRLQPLEDEKVCRVVGVVGDLGAPGSNRWSCGSLGSRLPATRRGPTKARCARWRDLGDTVGQITNRTSFRAGFGRNEPDRPTKRHTQQERTHSDEQHFPRHG